MLKKKSWQTCPLEWNRRCALHLRMAYISCSSVNSAASRDNDRDPTWKALLGYWE
jgi:hypothetical protein